ncbi:MAG: hypothetical protein KF754_11350 [Planctomycetes bacterium]|nr:hypothetical protein [Planctomycetota bacterium]
MAIRVSVHDRHSGDLLFCRVFDRVDFFHGLSMGGARTDDIPLPGSPARTGKLHAAGGRTLCELDGRPQPQAVEHGVSLEVAGVILSFADTSHTKAEVAQAVAEPEPAPEPVVEDPRKRRVARLLLTLVYEIAKLERGVQQLAGEFDMAQPETEGMPFEKWVLDRVTNADLPEDELFRALRQRVRNMTTLNMAAFETLQSVMEKVRADLDPERMVDTRKKGLSRLIARMTAWGKYQTAYGGAMASSSKFFNELIYPTLRKRWLTLREQRQSAAALPRIS